MSKFNFAKKKWMIYECYFIVCTCKLLRVKTISSVSKNLKCNDLNAKRLSCSSNYCFMLVVQIQLKAFLILNPVTDEMNCVL